MKYMRLFAVLLLAVTGAACSSVDKKTDGPDGKAGRLTGKPSPNRPWSVYTAKNGGYSDRVFFETDRHDLSATARQTIEAWSKWLQAHPDATILIEGHADERGTREYNLALGARRATSVRNYLTALGVASRRVRTVSFGKERPAVAGSSESAWAENRRGVARPRGGGS